MIALRLTESLQEQSQAYLDKHPKTAQFTLCIYSILVRQHLSLDHRRWPSDGWIEGRIDDLATIIEHAALSENQISDGMEILDL